MSEKTCGTCGYYRPYEVGKGKCKRPRRRPANPYLLHNGTEACKWWTRGPTKTFGRRELSECCPYRDASMNPVCYFGGQARYIPNGCAGCYEDGRNALNREDATAFAERGNA